MLSLLPDPFQDSCKPAFARTTSGVSTQVPEEPDSDDGGHTASPDGQEEVEELLLEGPAEAFTALDMPPLGSELGRWAQEVVSAQEWLARALLEDEAQQRARPTTKEYLVDKGELHATTMGLAYRCSKELRDRDYDVAGPLWGDSVWGVDHGDGWLQVGHRYLPMRLEGAAVLVERPEAPSEDEKALLGGPALTPSGCALDLADGSAIFFSHDRASATSAEGARKLKEDARLLQAARLAHSACEAEARLASGEAIAIDIEGGIYGELPRAGDACCASSTRARLFHRKRQARRCSTEGDAKFKLCAGSDGIVFLYLALGNTAEDKKRLYRKRWSHLELFEDERASGPMVVDVCGIVHI